MNCAGIKPFAAGLQCRGCWFTSVDLESVETVQHNQTVLIQRGISNHVQNAAYILLTTAAFSVNLIYFESELGTSTQNAFESLFVFFKNESNE